MCYADLLQMTDVDDDAYQALALAAHELRSPASVVAGYLRLLLKGHLGEVPEAQRKVLEQANQSCERILNLVRELSDLAALGRADALVKVDPLQIFALCDDVARSTANAGGDAIDFTCSDADRPAVVNGDAERLRGAFGALITAVRRECGAGGLDAHGFVDRTSEGSHAIIVLGSRGSFSRPDWRANQRVLTLDRWRGGMGMALPIACCIIEAHGGRVWSFDGDSRGTAAVSLPLKKTV